MSTFANNILKNQTAVVTGSSRGIGRAIALELASLGANIAVVYYGDNDTPLADEVKAEVEQLGGKVSVVRGVTTRTATDGVRDETWQDLSTVRVIDRVIPGIRNSLHTKFRRAKNTPRGRGAIRAQVVLELENFLKQEIITAYEGVTVTADETDPTRALVDFSFTVAHGLNQIWLSAHITV